jgi:hypothetical protein
MLSSKSSFGGCLPELQGSGFFIALAKNLDAVQQNRIVYTGHRKMSFFSITFLWWLFAGTLSSGFFFGHPFVPCHDPTINPSTLFIR